MAAAAGERVPQAGGSAAVDAGQPGFVLPPLPSVVPAAFELTPQRRDADADLLSTCSSSSSDSECCGRAGREYGARLALQSGDSSDSDGSDLDDLEELAGPSSLPTRLSGRSSGGEPAAKPEALRSASQPLQPLAWARGAKPAPEIARCYQAAAVVWAFVDAEGLLGLFRAAEQLHWWHAAHRLADLVVRETGVCQAEGGPRGFCFVAGIEGGQPGQHAAAALACATALIAAFGQVRLPNGEPVSVRVGLHFGPAGDGLLGSGKSIHYQMTGPTLWTAKQLALFAGPGGIMVSDALVRLLTAEAGSAGGTYGRSVAVPLTHRTEIAAHAYTGPLPQVSADARQLLAQWQEQTAGSANPFAAASLGFGMADNAQGAGASASSYPDVAWAEAKEEPSVKEVEMLAWEEREFAELYRGKRAAVCAAANLAAGGALGWWLAGPHAGRPGLRGHGPQALAALCVALLPALPALLPRHRSPLSAASRLARVALLMWTQYVALASGAMAASEHLMAFVAGASLLDCSDRPAHRAVDWACGAMAALALPAVLASCGTYAAFTCAAEMALGLALSRLLMGRPLQRPLRMHRRQAARLVLGKAAAA